MTNILIEAFSLGFFQRALIVGCLVAATCSLLGNFVVLRKEVIISHTISHLALLGIALGMILDFDLMLGVFVVSVVGVLLIVSLQNAKKFSHDSILEFVAQMSIALATVLVSASGQYQGDLLQYLFGDILALSKQDIWLAVAISLLVIIFIFFFRKVLLQSLFNEELARSSGVKNEYVNILFMFILALVVAVTLKIMGAILIAAFLVIPPNIAKIVAKSFKQMMILSFIFAVFGTLIGLFASYVFNLPSGSTIIVVMGIAFIFANFLNNFLIKIKKNNF